MLEGSAGPRRLPFSFVAHGGIGHLALTDLRVGLVDVGKLELEVSELGTDPGSTPAERFQRRRTRLRSLGLRITASAVAERVAAVRQQLAGHGITQLQARLSDSYISVRARAADGLAAADVSFRVSVVAAGTLLRALASHIRVHGHLPTPGPLIADRILGVLLGATDSAGVVERPHARGLCDVEVDVINSLLWAVMPPAGWRLPAVNAIDLQYIRLTRAAIEIAFGPSGSRASDIGIRPGPLALAAAHDLMHSADHQLRSGHIEEAMRGYRALLAAGGPEQPQLLERILALASARPAWFFDGLELARQALGRWPRFPAAHATLASITLAQGDAREAASHLTQLAQQASADGDDDQAALAALAGARLLRVLEPRAATKLYELALEHDPGSIEAADALADRLADEQRWPELVRLLRARAVTAEPARAVELRLRLADVFVHQLADAGGAQIELSAARELAPDDPAVHEMTATILASSNPTAALEAWREVARLAELRNDTRAAARALAIVGDLIAKRYTASDEQAWADAEVAWRRSLEIDPLQTEAIAGLATAAAARGDHEHAVEYYERLRGLGLPQHTSARYELMLAMSLLHLERYDEARASARRATLAGGETAAEAHSAMAEIAEATGDIEQASTELDVAINALIAIAADGAADDRIHVRAAELCLARTRHLAMLQHEHELVEELERMYSLAEGRDAHLARTAALELLEQATNTAAELRWVEAALAAEPASDHEHAELRIRRANLRLRDDDDAVGALADLQKAIALLGADTPRDAELRRKAHALEAEVLAVTGDQRARAQTLTVLARLAREPAERVATETAAASAWLAANEASAALPHSARAHAELASADVPAELRREVLVTLGEAAWRQRAWPDVIRAYRALVDDPAVELAKLTTFRYRLAVAGDRTGAPQLSLDSLAPLVEALGNDASPRAAETARATTPELRSQALRLYADLAERSGKLAEAAAALEGFANVASDSSPTSRADAMYRAGELFRRAELPDDAVRCLEAALRISDTHLPALDALEHVWRERNDLERVSVILGRKVAATGRHPQRQKPLLSRLGDLQDQLGRPDVALATHQRALEIDPQWRPSLRYVTSRLRKDGALLAAVGGFVQLCGELPGDAGTDLAIVARERQLAAQELSQLVAQLDDAQLDAVRAGALPALERAGGDTGIEVAAGLARLRGKPAPRPPEAAEENTPSGRMKDATSGALSLREAARRSRAAGKSDDAFASLEAANHVSPGDPEILRELVELALELDDHEAEAEHLQSLGKTQSGPRRGETLLALADVYYDKLEDLTAARAAMREAADAFGVGMRRDSTLRLLASEAATHLAWDIAVDAVRAIDVGRRTGPDHVLLATALVRAGKADEAVAVIQAATAAGKFEDGGLLLRSLEAEAARRARFRTTEVSATAPTAEHEVDLPEVWGAVGSAVGVPSLPQRTAAEEGSLREQLLAAHETAPEDPDALQKLLAYLEPREPELRKSVLERVSASGAGRVQAIACHELALIARGQAHDPIRAASLWRKAHRVDPSYTPVWMPLADALVAADEIDVARELYEQIAVSPAFDATRRQWAAERADALGHDDSVVSGEIGGKKSAPVAAEPPRPTVTLEDARSLAAQEKWREAIEAAEQVAEIQPSSGPALELLEQLYLEIGDTTAASEAIGRQLVLTDEPDKRAALWRRRAKLYRDALGREAEAYRCLKEAHACAPADPDIAYQLRTAAMVRGEWALVASLLYREIAAATSPRDRGALHLELALIFQEKLDDASQAQVNFEQALAFDPTIPAAKAPLAQRYEATGRHADAARLFHEAATTARAADRPGLLTAAARNRTAANQLGSQSQLSSQLERAEAIGEMDSAIDLAHQLWRAEPGHPAAFRVLANGHRTSGDLGALTELTTVRASRAATGEERAAAWLEVARLADDLGRLGEAARAYDRVLVEDPGNTAALDARGTVAFKMRDWATADTIYRDLDPRDSVLSADDIALRRSQIAEALGRREDALELAKQAATLAPVRHDVMQHVQRLATNVGDRPTAIAAALSGLHLIPPVDDEGSRKTRRELVELYRAQGELEQAIYHLDRIVRDEPHDEWALQQLAELHGKLDDWKTATRFLYQLVPLAPSAAARADRLFRLGDALLSHLGDVDRADDVFLRASDLAPSHIPTLQRLLDVYWRSDDPAALVEVATELSRTQSLQRPGVATDTLAQVVIAAALLGQVELARSVVTTIGDAASNRIGAALQELSARQGRLELGAAAKAIAELGKRGIVDVEKIRTTSPSSAVARALADSLS